MTRILSALLIVLLDACARALTVEMKEPPDHPGLYELHYSSWESLLNQYGEGAESVRRKLRAMKAPVEPADVRALWESAQRNAAANYVERTGQIPKECKEGLYAMSSGQAENGSGVVSFRCKSARSDK